MPRQESFDDHLKREQHRDYMRSYYHSTPERKAKTKARTKAYRMANPVATSRNATAYRKKNRQRLDAQIRAWNEAHPQRVRQNLARRKAARRNAPHDAMALAYLEVLYGDPCSYCAGLGEAVDHITAVTEGGTGDWTNLTAACKSCNSSKSTKPLLTYLLHRCQKF